MFSTETKPKVLFVLTSSSYGWYLPELAHPYSILAPHTEIVVASHLGGAAPLDPNSVEHFKDDEISMKFKEEHESLWMNTAKLDEYVGKSKEFAAIFYIGGFGPMFDIADSPVSHKIISEFYTSDKVVSGICHGVAAFSRVVIPETNTYLLNGHEATGISDAEIATFNTPFKEPFSVEESIATATGGRFFKDERPLHGKTVVSRGKDGKVVISGQNPFAGVELGKALFQEIFGKPWTA